ncbi:hypothetical protein HEMROJRC1_20530 [Rodentibacter sp. JRC1]|uniref:hypothetical protein n=1 Tax=Rodentibacter sp. JRC1 TaxID=2874504 RepID=UPI001CFF1D3D|nr:hypothetical protein [Rodentibacter sp. JRC1]GJI56941.1 hypothetical protein HEMROJRC1_20530 [Rodentibacter sp. JRC1]
MRDFLIKLLGGKTEKEYNSKVESMNQNIDLNYISRYNLDYASTLLKRWNEYRESINTLTKDALKNNSNYFIDNPSLLFDLVLQDYYFRRLFLLQNREDFFEEAEENITNFYKRNYGSLDKAFWEIEPKFLELIHSEKFIKDWNKF